MKVYYHSVHRWLEALAPRWYRRLFRYKKIIKYLISGGLAALTSITVLYIFTDFFQLWYLVSAALGFVASVVVSFLLQKFWTFESHSTNEIKSQFVVYSGVMVGALLLNLFLVYFFVEYMKLWYILAQIFAALVVAVTNFIFYQYLVFKQ